MAHGAVVQRRLSAEPRTPFLHQMYSKDLVVQRLQSLTWLFLIVWLFNAAVFFFYLWGEKILPFNHTYLIAVIGATLNGPCLSSVMVMIMRLCFALSSLVWWAGEEWWSCFTRFHPLFLEKCIFASWMHVFLFCFFCVCTCIHIVPRSNVRGWFHLCNGGLEQVNSKCLFTMWTELRRHLKSILSCWLMQLNMKLTTVSSDWLYHLNYYLQNLILKAFSVTW